MPSSVPQTLDTYDAQLQEGAERLREAGHQYVTDLTLRVRVVRAPREPERLIYQLVGLPELAGRDFSSGEVVLEKLDEIIEAEADKGADAG